MDDNKTAKWIKTADKNNRLMQATAYAMTKEGVGAINAPSALNSYAFHCRPLINTLSAFLPAGFEKSKIESLFLEEHEQHFLLSDTQDKIRKRMLISASYGTAYKVKHVVKTFYDLRNSRIGAS